MSNSTIKSAEQSNPETENNIDKKLAKVLPEAKKLPNVFLLIALISSVVFPLYSIFSVEPINYKQFHPLYLLVPILIIVIYYFFERQSENAKTALGIEYENSDLSEPEISRIIDKFSGKVDNIGTALPLFGAAILLGVVALGDPKNPSNDLYIKEYFMNLAVPFEVVSIVILAAAKLYETVFDELSLCYQQSVDESNNNREKAYHSEILEAIRGCGSSKYALGSTNLPEIITNDENYERAKALCVQLLAIEKDLKDKDLNATIDKILLIMGKVAPTSKTTNE